MVARPPDAARAQGDGGEPFGVGGQYVLFGARLRLAVQVEEAVRVRGGLVDVEAVALADPHQRAGAGDEDEPAGAGGPRGVHEPPCAGDVRLVELGAAAVVDDPGGAVQHGVAVRGGGAQRVLVRQVADGEFDTGQGTEPCGVAALAHQGAYVMALAQAGVDEVAAEEAGGPGDQDVHRVRHQVAP